MLVDSGPLFKQEYVKNLQLGSEADTDQSDKLVEEDDASGCVCVLFGVFL